MTGFVNSAVVFRLDGSGPPAGRAFVTVSNPQQAAVIDSLVIQLTKPPSGFTLAIDNIRLAQ
jgi:hypothetical protein